MNILNAKILKKFKLIIIVIAAALLAVILVKVFFNNREAKVDTEYIDAMLEKSSELITAKFNYTGMSEYEDTGIPIINKSDFVMVYKATARAGIDIKKVDVKIDNYKKIIYLTIPKAEVLDVKVDISSIKYFDEKFALLNINEKEDNNKAIALAEEAAKEEIKNIGVLEMADGQAETLIKGILEDAVPKNYDFEVIRK